MGKKQAELQRFFTEKAKHLQNEIDLEIQKIGGEGMLISREDLIHWVYHAREQVKTYQTICRMLDDQPKYDETDKILQELRDTVESDRADIANIRKKQKEERIALEQLQKEAEYYQQALEVLSAGD